MALNEFPDIKSNEVKRINGIKDHQEKVWDEVDPRKDTNVRLHNVVENKMRPGEGRLRPMDQVMLDWAEKKNEHGKYFIHPESRKRYDLLEGESIIPFYNTKEGRTVDAYVVTRRGQAFATITPMKDYVEGKDHGNVSVRESYGMRPGGPSPQTARIAWSVGNDSFRDPETKAYYKMSKDEHFMPVRNGSTNKIDIYIFSKQRLVPVEKWMKG